MQQAQQPQDSGQNTPPAAQAQQEQVNGPINKTATSNGQYHAGAHGVLMQHLQSLPPAQKQFIGAYLTPETLTLMGIIVGAEVYDTLKPYTDPSKMAIVVPRNNDQQGQAPQPLLQQNSQQGQQPQQAPPAAQAGQQAAGQPQPTPQA